MEAASLTIFTTTGLTTANCFLIAEYSLTYLTTHEFDSDDKVLVVSLLERIQNQWYRITGENLRSICRSYNVIHGYVIDCLKVCSVVTPARKKNIVFAEDTAGALQGVMIYEMFQRCEIKYIVSAPWNVTDRKCKGTGTALILHLVARARLAHLPMIQVSQGITSADFYTKAGFRWGTGYDTDMNYPLHPQQ